MATKVNISQDKELIPANGVIIQNIVVRPVQRKSQDIEAWRTALKAAEITNAVRVSLYDLYDEIMLDGRLTSLIEKRIMGVVKNNVLIVNANNEPIEALNDMLASQAFRELRKEIMLTKFWGISVIEITNIGGKFNYYSVPRKNIRPKRGVVTKEQYDHDGIEYRNPPYSKYVMEIGKYDDLGIILKACPYVIYKRGGFGDWANFAEIFGMPFREARYDGYNNTVRLQLEQALEQAGSSGYAILPKEAEITFHEAKSTQGSSELYNQLRQACNEEMAVLILGQTETTSKTAGKLGGNDQTHENTEDMINLSDRQDEISILNEKLIPILSNLGYPVNGGKFIHHVEDEKANLKDKVDMFVKLKNDYKLPIDDDYIYEETGIPKPADYNAQKAAQEQQQQQMQQVQQQPTNKPDAKKTKPTNEEDNQLCFFDKLRLTLADFFDQAPKS